MPPVQSGYGSGIVRRKAAVAIPLIRDIGHENYEVFDDSGRAARSDDFGKVAEHHERGRERPSEAIFRTSRELLTALPASGGTHSSAHTRICALMLKCAVVCWRMSWIMARSCSAGVKPAPIAPTPPPRHIASARSVVMPAKAMPAQANGCLQPKRSVNRETMLPHAVSLPRRRARCDARQARTITSRDEFELTKMR